MEFYRFDKDSGKKITAFNSDFIMSRLVLTDTPTHVACMHLEPGGIIGYHEAVDPQLLLIVGGEGLVRGEGDEYISVKTGDAVFWEKGEGHETKTDTGLTAIVVESDELIPSAIKSSKAVEVTE
ncbi:cupin domain-containing protein [Pseudalkalibacillus sp. SCS-8]|uniref:cupin domain-containing protein n=1 Tax=Pseudalkalibacillus nanhaiensis TaxID=3115291 RepID=UPI0032DA1B5E